MTEVAPPDDAAPISAHLTTPIPRLPIYLQSIPHQPELSPAKRSRAPGRHAQAPKAHHKAIRIMVAVSGVAAVLAIVGAVGATTINSPAETSTTARRVIFIETGSAASTTIVVAPPTTSAPPPSATTMPASGPAGAAPITTKSTTTAPPPPPSTSASADGCRPKTNSGGCYVAGQSCRNSDYGQRGIGADGQRIWCVYASGGWRWKAY